MFSCRPYVMVAYAEATGVPMAVANSFSQYVSEKLKILLLITVLGLVENGELESQLDIALFVFNESFD